MQWIDSGWVHLHIYTILMLEGTVAHNILEVLTVVPFCECDSLQLCRALPPVETYVMC